MPRFRDEWLLDRVLLDYMSGGSCACCGFQHFLLPGGTADLIRAMSDLETDQQKNEVAALEFHPWPPPLRDQVWADRVRLRQKLKADKTKYQTIWASSNHGEDNNNNINNQTTSMKQRFIEWCWKPETYRNYKRWFQIPRSEIIELIQQKYNIHSAFGVVLCAVVEQVAAFPLTEYPPDGRGSLEVEFEKALFFDRRGGFTLPLLQDDGTTLNEKMLTVWLNHMEHNIGSPGNQLLVRKASFSTMTGGENTDAQQQQQQQQQQEQNEDGDPDGPDQLQSAGKTSFASDRRIVRLLIARMWAELLEKKFKEQELATTTTTET